VKIFRCSLFTPPL
jgi:hypothetical protein